LTVEDIENLTRTPDGSEIGLRVRGHRAAYAVFSEGMARGVTVLDLQGARALDLPGNWFNRTLLHLRAGRETDSVLDLPRTHVHFPPVSRVAITWEGVNLSLARPSEPTLHYDAERQSIQPAPGVTVVGQPLGGEYWRHTLADLLREKLGSRRVLELAARWVRVDGAPESAGASVSARLPLSAVPTEPARAAAAWPPDDLGAMRSDPAPREGEWGAPSQLATDPSGQGAPLFLSTFLRPDPGRSDVRLELVAMDMRRLELRMEGGYEDPRPSSGLPGRGGVPKDAALLKRLRATFNGAFSGLHGIHTEERPCERRDDQRQRRDTETQQQPVVNATTLHRLVRNPPDEHQRRELDHGLALALDQMDEDRNGDRGQAREKQRREEGHGLSHPHQPLAVAQVVKQRLVEGLRRRQLHVVDA
jgi:hypothetical protein